MEMKLRQGARETFILTYCLRVCWSWSFVFKRCCVLSWVLNSDAGHIKCSRGPPVPTFALRSCALTFCGCRCQLSRSHYYTQIRLSKIVLNIVTSHSNWYEPCGDQVLVVKLFSTFFCQTLWKNSNWHGDKAKKFCHCFSATTGKCTIISSKQCALASIDRLCGVWWQSIT